MGSVLFLCCHAAPVRDARLPSDSGWSAGRCAALRSPSLRSIRAAHDGSVVEYTLAPGQQILVDTGNLAMCDATCTIDVQTVKGVKNVLFGGEGLFNTVITGPGRVVLQTMPISNFAGSIAAMLPSK